MPRKQDIHELSTLPLPGGDLVEYDHDNTWMALLTATNQRLNFRPRTVKRLLYFLKRIFERHYPTLTRRLSNSYRVIWKNQELTLQICARQERTYPAEVARAWYAFLVAIMATEASESQKADRPASSERASSGGAGTRGRVRGMGEREEGHQVFFHRSELGAGLPPYGTSECG